MTVYATLHYTTCISPYTIHIKYSCVPFLNVGFCSHSDNVAPVGLSVLHKYPRKGVVVILCTCLFLTTRVKNLVEFNILLFYLLGMSEKFLSKTLFLYKT